MPLTMLETRGWKMRSSKRSTRRVESDRGILIAIAREVSVMMMTVRSGMKAWDVPSEMTRPMSEVHIRCLNFLICTSCLQC